MLFDLLEHDSTFTSLIPGILPLQSRKQENYKSSLLSRIKRALDPGERNGYTMLNENKISQGVGEQTIYIYLLYV